MMFEKLLEMDNVRVLLRKIRFCIVLPLYQKMLVLRIRRKRKISVVFIASSLAMWRYQNLYELLCEHSRFNVSIVLLPIRRYAKEQQQNEIVKLMEYFDSLNIKYFVGGEDTSFDIRTNLQPDVLFYPYPYSGSHIGKDDFYYFRDRLLCYYPYAFWMSIGDWSYNELLHNYAWKLFYSTELHRKDAKRYAENRGCNVEVVGYPNADNFLRKEHHNFWKPQMSRKKRVIWAPHFTISLEGIVKQSNFLWLSGFMLELAEAYSDRIQFVFKPHPHLFDELCKCEEWGRDKAENYYAQWEKRENTQLETGEFVDLFMTSDAMIHDSGSFSVEYHYSKNPVMYIADNFEQQVAEKGEFGKLAMRQHYVGKCKDDIINFIENVVLKGDDPMKQGREEFYREYLLPPNGKTVAENTMDVFLKAFC